MHSRTAAGRVVNFFQVTDLKDCYLTVFLSGDFVQYATIPVGSVVLMINPSILPSKDGNKKIALSIHNAQYIKHIGKALDYGVCQGIQRNGNHCSNAVNLEISKYCMYHIRKTQEDISALRSDVNPESIKRNFVANNLSEGRFHVGHDVIDCRPLASSTSIDLTRLYRSKGKGGVYGGYVASRMLEKSQEEERKRENQEKVAFLKKRREMESKENANLPFLGRGMLPGSVIRLDEERLSKIHALKERLVEINQVKELSNNADQSNEINTSNNSVFNALLQSSKNLTEMKKTALTKESAYSEKALQDKVRILKERQEMLERKERARMQMMSIEITCYWCANCRKFVENGIGKEFCENQGHFLERRRELKRMFECQECHGRTPFIGIERPMLPCACGGYVWKPCTLYKEKNVKMEELKITTPNTHVLYCHDVRCSVYSIFISKQCNKEIPTEFLLIHKIV